MLFQSYINYPKNVPITTPPTGMHRKHNLPGMFQVPPDKKKEKEKENAERRRRAKTPKQLIEDKLRSASAPPIGHPRLSNQ